MKIAFLGKGGSGKSTLATACVRHFQQKGFLVLVVDADHNMDLSFNLGVEPRVYLGSDPYAIKRFLGLSDDAGFVEARTYAAQRGFNFHLNPADEFTKNMSTQFGEKTLLMAAGPHTDIVRKGVHCSHSLAAPLKTYLPLLTLNSHEAVVIDERAGTDPVATGILAGIDLAVIVAEPTLHSVRVATQIAQELSLARVPFVFVANKFRGDEGPFVSLSQKPIAFVPFADSPDITSLMERLTA